MDQQYGLELLRENQKLRDEIERLNTELQQMKAAVPDYDILEQTSQEGLVNIVVGLMNELERYKEALKTIKTYSSGPIITIGESDGEEGFPEGSVYGYNSAIEQITNEVINPLLGESKPKEDDDETHLRTKNQS